MDTNQDRRKVCDRASKDPNQSSEFDYAQTKVDLLYVDEVYIRLRTPAAGTRVMGERMIWM